MKKYTIELEVDDNITTEDIQHAIEEMADNLLDTKECLYSIYDENEEQEEIQKRYRAVWSAESKGYYLADDVNDTVISLPEKVQKEAMSRLCESSDAAEKYLEDLANNKRPDWLDDEANTFEWNEIEL